MATFLFDKIIFGPVTSRRLGQSLGINLLPTNKKICNFDCIYCECGLTESTKGDLPTAYEVASKLEELLKNFLENGKKIDTITFAGNGEPTLHSEFEQVVDTTFDLRNRYFPAAKIALLTNSTTLESPKIQRALQKVDQNILKIDSVNETTLKLLNCPLGNFNIRKTIERIKSLSSPIIQTMFVRGSYKEQLIDNTISSEIVPWLATLEEIKPSLVMIYTIARDTPFDTLKKVPMKDLENIASKVKNLGLEVQISS